MDERVQQRTVAFVDGPFPQIMGKNVEVVNMSSRSALGTVSLGAIVDALVNVLSRTSCH